MNLKIAAAIIAATLAALGLLSPDAKPNPIEAARQNNLGCAYMNQQLFEKGLKSFQQALEADPKLTIARLNEGIAYLNLQKVDEAKASLEAVVKDDPKSAHAWYNLGLLAKNSGDAQAAIDAFKHVTEIDANDADTWYFLGTAYVQAKQFPQAIESFQHALQLNPLHASATFGLSRAYQQSGDIEHAREHLKKFQYITQNKIGSPMSLAYGEQGLYSRAVESQSAVLKAPAQIPVKFVDVTRESGLTSKPSDTSDFNRQLGPGACLLDYDNDGKIDIFVADGGAQSGMSLYHNLGNGKFEDITKRAGINPSMHGIGCTTGDYDNDGWTDIAVSGNDGVLLFHNEKNGTFKEKAGSGDANIGANDLNLGLTFIDYDHDGDLDLLVTRSGDKAEWGDMFRNNGDGTFTNVSEQLGFWDMGSSGGEGAIGTDYNNDRAVDILVPGLAKVTDIGPAVLENPREGKFVVKRPWLSPMPARIAGAAVLDFDHDGWMDAAFSHSGWTNGKSVTIWRNEKGKKFDPIEFPKVEWRNAYGVAAFDYDNDGWVDLVAVGETKEGKGEIKLFRNLGPDGFKDVTADVGLDKIHLESPRAIITGDYDNDGAVDLLITQNHGPAVLLRNEGGNKNHWLRLALKGLNDNKSAIGTKVEVFSGGNRQKFEIYGSNGYLGQNSPYLTVGLGDAKEADIVRMLWPTGVLQDEIQIAGDKQQDFLEIDRRGSSCPTLFAWNGERYEFVADMLGAGVVGHWIGPNQRDIPRPVEWIKIPSESVQEKILSVQEATRDVCHPEAGRSRAEGPNESQPLRCSQEDHQAPQEPFTPPTAQAQSADVRSLAPASPPLRMTSSKASGEAPTTNDQRPTTLLSFRFMEPLEEAVYLDQVRLVAVDHPANTDVYPNEYFASNPPYPEFKVVVSRNAQPPAAAWDEHGHNLLPELLAHKFVGDFRMTQFAGFAQPHSLTLDLGEPYTGGPLWLLLHGEVEYFTANSMYAASQAGLQAYGPYIEALGSDGKWKRVIDDMGFPAGGPRTMTADLSGKLPKGTQKIRLTTNLQLYWDSILIDRTEQHTTREIPWTAGKNAVLRVDAANAAKNAAGTITDGVIPKPRAFTSGARDLAGSADEVRLTSIPLVRANLQYHGYPLKIEGTPPGNVKYIYEQASATGPYTRPMGTYTRYGDVLPLLTNTDDKLAVFGSGDEVQLDFNPAKLPALPSGWVRDYFFAANGYEKDMDFYAAEGNYVAPLPFLSMGDYPYAKPKAFPLDDAHVNYLLEYNTRHMSGNEQRGYWFDYSSGR